MDNRYFSLLIVIMIFLVSFTDTSGQRRQQPQKRPVIIESVIVDENGVPVANAIVSGKEGAIEVITDAQGRFSIEVPENTDLLIEAKGFNNLVISAGLVSDKLTLTREMFLMDQFSLVNVAFGQMYKREITGAVSVIDPKDILKYDNSQFINDLLRGRALGMLGDLNMRGIGTPVFIVDGVPRDALNINAEEVDQITILKDANSAILWGSQAKNGVILITTKRGQALKRKINISVEQGLSSPIALPKYLNSADYMTLYNEALANDGLAPAFHDTIIQKYAEGKNPYRYPSVDYYSNEFLKSSRPFRKLLTEFSGGNQIAQYYANVGWIHTGPLYALVEGQGFGANRFNIRGNVDFKVTNDIKSFVDALVIIDGDKNPRNNYWSYASTLLPHYFSPILPVSLVKSDATGKNNLLIAKYIEGKYILGGTSQYTNNIYGNMYLAGYTQNIKRTARFSTGVDVNLNNVVQGLKFKTFLSLDVYNAYIQSVDNTYAVYTPVWTTFASGDSITSLTRTGADLNTGVQNLSDGGYFRRFGTYAALDYNRVFSDVHRITGTLLAYFDQLNSQGVIIDPKNSHLGLRVTYDYQRKYIIDFSGALVNGFKLEKGKKGGFSPSLGLGWIISEEDFLSNISAIDFLKLRASAGIINYEWTGTNYRLYESTLGTSSSYSWLDGTRSRPSTVISRSGNPDLTFEKMKTINMGFEGYFFSNLLYIDANLFSTRNSGLVIRRSIYAPFVGPNYPYENYDENGYSGGELGLMVSKSVGDLSLDIGANALYARSKIIKRDEMWLEDYQYREGRSTDVIFGLESLGFFNTSDFTNGVLNSGIPLPQFGTVKPGDIRYKDQNGDNVIDQSDEVEIGNSIAPFSYGLSLNLRYKNLNLFALGNGRNGAENFYSGSYFWVQSTNKYSEEVINRWTPSTASTATYPRLTSGSSLNNFRTSTFWMYTDNYFTIDRVQLNFEFPSNMARKLYTKTLTLYLRGENLARFSEDKEKRQLVIGSEPLFRNYAVGIRMMF